MAKAEAASPEAASILHAAALDELAETRESTGKARRSVAYRVGNAVNEWKALVQAKPPEISPAVKTVIQQMDRREERAKDAAQDPRRVSEMATGRSAIRSAERAPEAAQAASRPARAAAARPEVGATGVPRGGIAKGPEATRKRPVRAGPAEAVKGPAIRPPASVRSDGREGDGRDERVAQAKRVGNVAPRAQGVAGRAGVAPLLRPASMEDALRVRMPPTVPELEAASCAVSRLIRAVTAGEEDVDVRMKKVELLVDAMKAAVRRRQGLPPLEGDALKPTSMRLEESSSPGQASPRAGGRVQASPAVVPRAPSGPRDDGATTVPTTPGLVGIPIACGELRPGGAVGSPGVAVGADQGPSRFDGKGREGAPEVPEDPDDARRRKKRKEELERRKRQRQAVLARKNRGKGR